MLLALMALLVVAAVVWMTRPLWRGAVDAGQRRRAANVAAYRQRLAELEADSAAGLVDADTAASLRTELDSRLLRDASQAESVAPPTPRAWMFGAALGALILAVALGGYLQRGTWKLQQQIAVAPPATTPREASVEEMLAALEKRLADEPADVEGWALLGRSQFSLGNYQQAAQAFARANALTDESEPDLLVDEGEAAGFVNRRLEGLPRARFGRALKLDPAHGKALFYAGLAAEQAGERAQARLHWTALAQQPDLPPTLRSLLAERLGTDAVAAAPAEPAPESSLAASGVVLDVAVRLAPELAARVPPDATLFVFARAESGPPMPLAVVRGKASELPRQVRLDDSMAMTPASKLSQFNRWVLTARISRSGQPQGASGDFEGRLTVARSELGKSALEVVIRDVLP